MKTKQTVHQALLAGRQSLWKATTSRISIGVALLLVVTASLPGVRSDLTAAATCGSISECQQQINSDNATVANLQSEATSYSDAIDKLASQIASIQKQISLNEDHQAQLKQQIIEDQAKIAAEKQVLGQDLRTMYIDGSDMTTIEMLATSNNLSDYVDKEEYRSVVQSKIQSTLDEITKLQATLQRQKVQVDALLVTQRKQQAQVEAAQAEQQRLLTYNQAQQAAYSAEAAQNQQKLQDLIAAQLAANNSYNNNATYYFIRFPGAIQHDPIDGSYPYANWGFGMSTAPGCVDNDGPDQWGYCTRQCVSYAAWAVSYSGREAPMFWGNANQWVSAAENAGIPVYTSNPQPGDVAIDTAGTWGHAMYVEGVKGDQIYVSQYNQQLTGQFSTQWRTWR